MDLNNMLKCLIAFILGYLVSRQIGNGFNVGGVEDADACNTNLDACNTKLDACKTNLDACKNRDEQDAAAKKKADAAAAKKKADAAAAAFELENKKCASLSNGTSCNLDDQNKKVKDAKDNHTFLNIQLYKCSNGKCVPGDMGHFGPS
jgi:hypothetical protein